MTEPKKPYVGENGRLYFNYPVGAEYQFRNAAGNKFSLRIIGCEYDSGKEYYFLESAGKELPARFSVEKLDKQLAAMPYEVLNEGKRLELPLLKEEVEKYYGAKEKERSYANAKENEKLKGTQHSSLVQANGKLKKRLMLAEADGRADDAAQINAALAENNSKIAQILADKGIDIKILRKIPDCEQCGDTGIVKGDICVCALKRGEQIKAFNAALRLIGK